MAAVTLGRMKAKEALGTLRMHCREQKVTSHPIHNACGWAIERITGEAMRPADPVRDEKTETLFLTPSW